MDELDNYNEQHNQEADSSPIPAVTQPENIPEQKSDFFKEESYYSTHPLPPRMGDMYPQNQYAPPQNQYAQPQNQYAVPQTPRVNPQAANYQSFVPPNIPPQQNVIPQPSPEKKKKNTGLIICIVIIGVLLLSVIGISVLMSLDRDFNVGSHDTSDNDSSGVTKIELPVQSKPDVDEEDVDENGKYTPQGIYKLLSPAVVGITTYGEGGTFDPLGSATGIIISTDGYIVTNAHVVADAVEQKVTLIDNKEFIAEVVGYDVKTDLAVLKIDPKDYELSTAELGNSEELEMGEQVFAIGNPGGFTNSLTGGYVSGLNRDFTSPDGYSINCIQTDAALNPGNSGGPLINLYGQVVGINAFGYVGETGDYQSMNFAIAINDAIPVITDIINNGYVKGRIRIGIMFNEITPVTAEMYDTVPGLYIMEIDPTCDIAKTQLKQYDIITEINGKAVYDAATVQEALDGKKPGDIVKAKIYRKGITGEETEFEISFMLMELTE